MRRLLATSLALGLLTIAPAQLFAKANTVRIKISGAGLHVPIEITDAKTLANFWVWGGPGSGPYKTQSFIVDWARPVAPPPSSFVRYTVHFYGAAKASQDRLIYVVHYAYDPSTRHGYVYIPGKKDKGYQLNVSAILRGVEGNWFRAWNLWDATAAPLIENASSAGASASH